MFKDSAQISMRLLGGVFLLVVGGGAWLGFNRSVKSSGGERAKEQKIFQQAELKQGGVTERKGSTLPFFSDQNKSSAGLANDWHCEKMSSQESAQERVTSADLGQDPRGQEPRGARQKPSREELRKRALADGSLTEQELPNPPESCRWPFFILLFNPELDSQRYVSDGLWESFNRLEKKAVADAVALFQHHVESMPPEGDQATSQKQWLTAQFIAEEHLRLTLGHDAFNRLSRFEELATAKTQ